MTREMTGRRNVLPRRGVPEVRRAGRGASRPRLAAREVRPSTAMLPGEDRRARLIPQPWQPIRLLDVAPALPLSFLCGPLLVQGETTTLYGDGESGKSLLAAAFAVSIAAGVEVIPGWQSLRGPVLILDFEAYGGIWRTRIERIAAGASIATPLDAIHYLPAPGSLASGRSELASVIQSIGPALVIVDSTGFALGDEDEDADPKNSILAMHRVLREWMTTVLLIDHISKHGTTHYGSVYKRNAARESFFVTRHSGLIALEHKKANYRARIPAITLGLTFDDPDGAITFRVEDMVRTRRATANSISDRVREALLAEPDLPNQELYRRFPEVRRNTLRAYAARIRKAKQV